MHKQYDPGIDTLIDNVVQFGSHYRMEQMDTLYTADQSILFLSGDKTVTRVPRDAMMAEFITFSCGTTNAPTPCNDDLCRYGSRPVVDTSPLPKRIEPNCLGPLLVGLTSTFRHKRRRIIVTIRLEPRRELLRLS